MLRPITREVASRLLEGELPDGVFFAPGYPSRFSLEVMHMVQHPGAVPAGHCFIVRRDDDAVLGEIGFWLDPRTATAKVGYSVVEPSWGQGVATEALRGLLAHLLARSDVQRVLADTIVDHTASRRVMEKAGMHLTGLRPGFVDGRTVELAGYEIGP